MLENKTLYIQDEGIYWKRLTYQLCSSNRGM